jgi:hypothetical protein
MFVKLTMPTFSGNVKNLAPVKAKAPIVVRHMRGMGAIVKSGYPSTYINQDPLPKLPGAGLGKFVDAPHLKQYYNGDPLPSIPGVGSRGCSKRDLVVMAFGRAMNQRRSRRRGRGMGDPADTDYDPSQITDMSLSYPDQIPTDTGQVDTSTAQLPTAIPTLSVPTSPPGTSVVLNPNGTYYPSNVYDASTQTSQTGINQPAAASSSWINSLAQSLQSAFGSGAPSTGSRIVGYSPTTGLPVYSTGTTALSSVNTGIGSFANALTAPISASFPIPLWVLLLGGVGVVAAVSGVRRKK